MAKCEHKRTRQQPKNASIIHCMDCDAVGLFARKASGHSCGIWTTCDEIDPDLIPYSGQKLMIQGKEFVFRTDIMPCPVWETSDYTPDEERKYDPVCYKVTLDVINSIREHVKAAQCPEVPYMGDMDIMRDMADKKRELALNAILVDLKPYS